MSSKSLDSKRHPLSPELSERLKPDSKERHHSNRDHHDFQRRRQHRRANKRGRRHKPPRDRTPGGTPCASLTSPQHQSSGGEGQQQRTLGSGSKTNPGGGRNGDPHRRPTKAEASKQLVLRPTKGPGLCAPKNSTQFIIDDHETSPFLDDDVDMSSSSEEISPKKYNTRSREASLSLSRRVSISGGGGGTPTRGSPEKNVAASGTTTSSTSVTAVTASTAVISSSSSSSVRQYQGGEAPTSGETGNASDRKTGQATPGNYVVNDDDYTLWAEFSERDFQTVYESAHQEEVADWDRHRLIEEITSLEKRQKELVNILARVDPEMYAQKLEDQLEALQEKNRLLRSTNGLSSPEPSQPLIEVEVEGSEDSEVLIVTSKSQPSPRESPDTTSKE